MQRLLQAAPELGSSCERVDLQLGPWSSPDGMADDGLYFPETGLLALSLPSAAGGSSAPFSARLALLGCHSVWSPRQAQDSDFLARVIVPGHAMRVSEAVVRAVEMPLANWWLQVAASNQHLIAQIARMALCTQNHSAPQSLASWLLTAQHNSGVTPLQMPMLVWRDGLGWDGHPMHGRVPGMRWRAKGQWPGWARVHRQKFRSRTWMVCLVWHVAVTQ